MSAAQSRTNAVLWAIGPGFLLVAGWLLFLSPSAKIPLNDIRIVARADIKPGAFRNPLMDANLAEVDGIRRPCSECHKLFTTSTEPNRTLVQHKDIQMSHGMNTRCLNCHDNANRDKLVLHDGTLVGFNEAPRLCSQCHGTVYRDWVRGMHGKTMGSWVADSGEQTRLACNQCHDPHSPAYRPMAPLPGPDTLRMGDQSIEGSHTGRHSPLRQWSQRNGEHEAESTPAEKEHDE